MIVYIATYIAHMWVSSGVISEEDEANYYYGLQLLLSSLFNLAVIIGVSIFFRAPLAWIPFMLSFATSANRRRISCENALGVYWLILHSIY